MRSPDRQSAPRILAILALMIALVATLSPALFAQPPAGAAPATRGPITGRIDLRGSALVPAASGVATLQRKQGYTAIHAEFDRLPPPDTFGLKFVTYVAWAITPIGDAVPLGEVKLSIDRGTLDATTDLESFALLVTAEQDLAASEPSDAVVLVSVFANTPSTSQNTGPSPSPNVSPNSGTTQTASEAPGTPALSQEAPLEFQEAFSAIEMARMAGAETYAPDQFQHAEKSFQQAEVYLSDPDKRDEAITLAREAAQAANDARVIADSSKQEAEYDAEREALERELEAARSELAGAQSQAAVSPQPGPAVQQARQDLTRVQNEANDAQAAEVAEESQLAAEREEATADLESSERTNAIIQREAEIAQQTPPAEQDPEALRARLQEELNKVAKTRQTADSLIVSLPDDLFYVNAATMKQDTRDMLSQVAGVLLAHPGLTIDVRPVGPAEGENANSFTEMHRQNVLMRRARAVAAFLVSLGVKQKRVEAGLAESAPDAENTSVEVEITGEAITPVPTA